MVLLMMMITVCLSQSSIGGSLARMLLLDPVGGAFSLIKNLKKRKRQNDNKNKEKKADVVVEDDGFRELEQTLLLVTV